MYLTSFNLIQISSSLRTSEHTNRKLHHSSEDDSYQEPKDQQSDGGTSLQSVTEVSVSFSCSDIALSRLIICGVMFSKLKR